MLVSYPMYILKLVGNVLFLNDHEAAIVYSESASQVFEFRYQDVLGCVCSWGNASDFAFGVFLQ
jgi:hypothetical protein